MTDEQTTYITIPFLEPPAYQVPCPDCGGKAITGDQYMMRVDSGVLVVDVLCPTCGGCGNGDLEHTDCPPMSHAGWRSEYDFEDDSWGDDVEHGPGQPPCPSCEGREWNAIQGFSDTGEGDIVYMRVPCGCTEGRAQLVKAV